ncbi:hypothetical protein SAMN02745194_03182 [Roseomonas rosea]|uniref:Glycosyltransferase subfamily 4-like N-terminal domain-containing protein n=1 Tax=Muricoccus roseus TaxID=198092 RepID=A0A1M6LHW4_9PROT|nr:glycosyltransferase [Roseomonas rosea]SHJ70767.1 hypothetical protein SAMN02745194_03182 [Roseomonas rosea]
MPSDPSSPLTVLLTNITLGGRTGSEILTRNIALGLRRQGHRPIVYSPVHGPLVDELRLASVPVAADIREITRDVDIVHGHHTPTAATAAVRFSHRPALFLCQDFRQWHDIPPVLPNILKNLVVSSALVDRLSVECGVPEERIALMLNPVDTRRFTPGEPLPAAPKKAALFAKGRSYVEAVREACQRRGLALTIFGSAVGQLSDAPEKVMPHFDIVFASGLTAMEAMACGRAVIVCDPRGLAGMCTTERLPRFRQWNFGLGVLDQPLTADCLAAELDRYDAGDAALAADRLRAEAGLDDYIERLVAIYRETIATFDGTRTNDPDWNRSVAEHLQRWSPRTHAAWPWMQEREALLDRITELEIPVSPIQPGERYGFTPQETRPWLRKLNGLGRSEGGGTWTTAPRATMLIRLGQRPSGPSRFELLLKPLLGEKGQSREVDVIANGERVAEWRFTGTETRLTKAVFEVPEDVVGAAGEVWLVLRILNPQTPRELGLKSDDRPLGICLNSLTLLKP